MYRRNGIGMLGRKQGRPRWEDDPVRRCNRRCRQTAQEADSPFGGNSNGSRGGQGVQE